MLHSRSRDLADVVRRTIDRNLRSAAARGISITMKAPSAPVMVGPDVGHAVELVERAIGNAISRVTFEITDAMLIITDDRGDTTLCLPRG